MNSSLQMQSRLVDSLQLTLRELHGATVEIVETHLSWVLLVADHAYKIKKALRFAFADFSTLKAREENCRRELQLNRRFAPDIYVDVVRISGTIDHPTIDGDESAIEYAVKLRRFQKGDELEALLSTCEISAADLARFGSRLASIHEDSPVCGDRKAAARQRQIAIDNAMELRRFASDHAQNSQNHLEWLIASWQKISISLCERADRARVRECHGDLHVGNIVRWAGELVAFDCIEFNPDLSCIDVASDVAFLFMDLLAHYMRDLAYAFLSAWCESSGDYEAIAVLRFFAVHRALVRAKVAALEKASTRVELYLQLASKLEAKRRPRLLITCGLSGSGKTWLSEQLIAALGAVRVRSDVERKRMAGLKATESSVRHGLDIYSREFNTQVYERLSEIAGLALHAGETLIVDAAFLRRTERLAFMELAALHDAAFVIVHCSASDHDLRRRLKARREQRNDASEADERVLDQQHGFWEPFAAAESAVSVHVDTSIDTVDAVAAALKLRMKD